MNITARLLDKSRQTFGGTVVRYTYRFYLKGDCEGELVLTKVRPEDAEKIEKKYKLQLVAAD